MDRDVIVLFTTGEEIGLLGAEAFAENPPVPLKNIVAAFNIDRWRLPRRNAGGHCRAGDDGSGHGYRHGGARTEAQAVRVGRTQSLYPAAGWLGLMSHDLPAVMVTSAYGDINRLEKYFDTDYHRPQDVVKPGLELGGAAEDVAFHVALVQYFADTKRFPATVLTGTR
jgi:acetylornithine deacetylase/succinyl-diaminopimelate desuccinylase-like protein